MSDSNSPNSSLYPPSIRLSLSNLNFLNKTMLTTASTYSKLSLFPKLRTAKRLLCAEIPAISPSWPVLSFLIQIPTSDVPSNSLFGTSNTFPRANFPFVVLILGTL